MVVPRTGIQGPAGAGLQGPSCVPSQPWHQAPGTTLPLGPFLSWTQVSGREGNWHWRPELMTQACGASVPSSVKWDGVSYVAGPVQDSRSRRARPALEVQGPPAVTAAAASGSSVRGHAER